MSIEINTYNDIPAETRPFNAKDMGFMRRFGTPQTQENSQENTPEPEYYDAPGLTIYGDMEGHTLIMPQSEPQYDPAQGWVAYGTTQGETLYYQKKEDAEHDPAAGWVEYSDMNGHTLWYKTQTPQDNVVTPPTSSEE